MQVGVLQRNVNPIPPGRYWILLSGQGPIDVFGAWIRDTQGGAGVEVMQENRERQELFAIFNVRTQGHVWPARLLGFPEIAPPEIRSMDDVVKPDAPTPLERILQTTPDSILDRLAVDLPSLTRGLATAAVIILLIYILAQSRRS